LHNIHYFLHTAFFAAPCLPACNPGFVPRIISAYMHNLYILPDLYIYFLGTLCRLFHTRQLIFMHLLCILMSTHKSTNRTEEPNMKKLLALLLAVILVLSLAACTSTAKDDEPASDASDAAKLTMATEATFPPYEYYDGDAIVGIDVEVAQAIAEKLGMELEVTDIAFDSIIPGIQTGKYDMGMAGMTVTDERKEQVSFSDSYATGVQVVIVKDDSAITSVDDLLADGANTVVGTQAGTTGFLYATSDIEEAGLGTVKSFGKTTDAVEALKNGQIDCVILDNEPAKALVAANEGLHILDTEYAVEDYAIAIAKENTELLEKVNKALSELKADGTLQSIVDKYIGK